MKCRTFVRVDLVLTWILLYGVYLLEYDGQHAIFENINHLLARS